MRASECDNIEVWLERRRAAHHDFPASVTLAEAEAQGPASAIRVEWERVDERPPRMTRQDGRSTLSSGFDLEVADTQTHHYRVCINRGQRSRSQDSHQGDLQVVIQIDQQSPHELYLEGNTEVCYFDLWTASKRLPAPAAANTGEASASQVERVRRLLEDDLASHLAEVTEEDLAKLADACAQAFPPPTTTDTSSAIDDPGPVGIDRSSSSQSNGAKPSEQSTIGTVPDDHPCGSGESSLPAANPQRALIPYRPRPDMPGRASDPGSTFPSGMEVCGLDNLSSEMTTRLRSGSANAENLRLTPLEGMLPPPDNTSRSADSRSSAPISGPDVKLELAELFQQLGAQPDPETDGPEKYSENAIIGGDDQVPASQTPLPQAAPVHNEADTGLDQGVPRPKSSQEHESRLLLHDSAEDQLRTLTVDIYRGYHLRYDGPRGRSVPCEGDLDFGVNDVGGLKEWMANDFPGSPWCRFVYEFAPQAVQESLILRIDDAIRQEAAHAQEDFWDILQRDVEDQRRRMVQDALDRQRFEASERHRLTEEAAEAERAEQEKKEKRAAQQKASRERAKARRDADKALHPPVQLTKTIDKVIPNAPRVQAKMTSRSATGSSYLTGRQRSDEVLVTPSLEAERRPRGRSSSRDVLVPATPESRPRSSDKRKAREPTRSGTSRHRDSQGGYDRISHYDPIVDEPSPPRRSREPPPEHRIPGYRPPVRGSERQEERCEHRPRQDRARKDSFRPISSHRDDHRAGLRSPSLRRHRQRSTSPRPKRDDRGGRMYRIPYDPVLSHLTRRRQSDGPGAYGLSSPYRRDRNRNGERRHPSSSLESESSEEDEELGSIAEQRRAYDARERERAAKGRKLEEKEARRADRREEMPVRRPRQGSSARLSPVQEERRRATRSITPVKSRSREPERSLRETMAARAGRAAMRRMKEHRGPRQVIDLTQLDSSD